MIPSWAVAGTFVICTNDRWNTFSGLAEDVVVDPPRMGTIYTVAGAFVAPGSSIGFYLPKPPDRVAVILAEYPNFAFDIVNFAPSPMHLYPMFRLLLNPKRPIIDPETLISANTPDGKAVRWVV